MQQIDTVEQISAGAILCSVNDGDIEILLLMQNNAFYNRAKKDPVVDIGPKGQLKRGEQEREAAVREIKEETGLDLELDDGFREELLYVFDDVSRVTGKIAHIKKKVVFFLAYITERDVENIKLSDEHIGCRLVGIDEALNEIRHESQKRIIRVVKDYVANRIVS